MSPQRDQSWHRRPGLLPSDVTVEGVLKTIFALLSGRRKESVDSLVHFGEEGVAVHFFGDFRNMQRLAAGHIDRFLIQLAAPDYEYMLLRTSNSKRTTIFSLFFFFFFHSLITPFPLIPGPLFCCPDYAAPGLN